MTDLDRRVLLGLAGIAGAAAVGQLARAGSLNPPPGPVAPTGKTTEQIEPRIDLLNAPAGANVSSDANSHYIINNSGSYYLSGNLAVTKSIGITVLAAGVSLDLCGFEIFGVAANAATTGVLLAGEGARIGNGSLRALGNGADASTAYACAFTQLTCTQRLGAGLLMSISGFASACLLRNNAAGGIAYTPSGSFNQGSYCNVSDCVADGCGIYGFFLNDGSTLTRCIASRCTADTVPFQVGSGCQMIDCVARDNGPAATAFKMGSGGALTRCTATDNVVDFSFGLLSACTLVVMPIRRHFYQRLDALATHRRRLFARGHSHGGRRLRGIREHRRRILHGQLANRRGAWILQRLALPVGAESL